MNNIKKPRLKKNLDKGYLNKIKGSELLKNVFSAINKLSDIGLSKIKESLYNDKGELDMDKLKEDLWTYGGVRLEVEK